MSGPREEEREAIDALDTALYCYLLQATFLLYLTGHEESVDLLKDALIHNPRNIDADMAFNIYDLAADMYVFLINLPQISRLPNFLPLQFFWFNRFLIKLDY
jgi:hypothetical protein